MTNPARPTPSRLSCEAGLKDRLPSLAGRRVLVIGDLMLDQYIWGDVRRISPSAPVPVVRQRRTTWMLGGAANVARNLAAAGATVDLVGLTGRDGAADTFRGLIAEMKITADGVLTDPARPTIVKSSIWAKGQQLLRLDIEAAAPVEAAIEARLIAAIRTAACRADAIVLSDYAKGVLAPAVIQAAVESGRERRIPLVADPKSPDFRHYNGVDYLTPNLKEAGEAAGVKLDTESQIEREGRRLIRRYHGKGLLLTRAGDGFSLITPRRHLRHPARAPEVSDETGCGDTFIAHFALGLAAGWDAEAAAILGNIAAGIVAGKVGSAVVSPEELAAALGGDPHLGKIRSAEGLTLLVETLRGQGRRIVFTNGCFDLIHVGHIRHLHEARRLGDVLIVALNTDDSVRRIKGAPRPILPAPERAAVLAALDVVDIITFFGDDSPERLIEQLRPDILVKGQQGAGGEVVGAGIVQAYGGQVIELPLFGDSKTDELLRKIQGGAEVESASAPQPANGRRRTTKK